MNRASGCSNNEELSATLAEMETLRSPHVIQAFRHVDRGFFVPEPDRATIYDDTPFRKPLGGSDGALHMSAPHMYASSLETLEMEPGSGHSFLNIGSGANLPHSD
jgi:protein-L-isoaspartate O-methyltransferase